jgi:hypothetical protein
MNKPSDTDTNTEAILNPAAVARSTRVNAAGIVPFMVGIDHVFNLYLAQHTIWLYPLMTYLRVIHPQTTTVASNLHSGVVYAQ